MPSADRSSRRHSLCPAAAPVGGVCNPELFRSLCPAAAPVGGVCNPELFDKAIATLNALIDEVDPDEQYPLYDLLDTLGVEHLR